MQFSFKREIANGRAMTTTSYQLSQITKYNRDGSQNTKQTRFQNLTRFIKHMQENRGYANSWDLNKLGKKDIHRYVRDLKDRGLAHRTIANNLKDIRWLASKVNREKLIPSNRDCGLKQRVFNNENKAVRLNAVHLAKLDDRMKLINLLKSEFGLREKEALKFNHAKATTSPNKINLEGNWCKNGRPRSIEIVNDRQRELLQKVGEFQKQNGDYSMIPKDLKFATYRDYVQDKTKELGFKGHGLRHQWAHDRFHQLAGMPCPIAGGLAFKDLDQEQKERWEAAAQKVNQELGHGKDRLDTTATYIGR